ncbi:MAG: Hint domain-containing protein, partial [Proteobacteria bacterium]|nr:Hint domain-containing protein [Pseudomonadota bacterium]
YFDWVDPVGNFFMGAADTVTMGATGWIRDKAGLSDQVNPCSSAYRYGGHAATGAEFAFGATALAKGLGRFAARRMAKRLCRMSFAGGTLIETKQGYKPIEDIAVGDEVWSRDDRTGAEGWARVVRVFVRHNAEVLDVTLLEADGDKLRLAVTPEHPLMTRDVWAAVGKLDLGEQVSSGDGWAEVVSIASSEERATVYNFEVEGTHTYYVGTGGLWAHNGCGTGGAMSWSWKSTKTFGHTFKTHGAGAKNFRRLLDRARTQGQSSMQGQWLNNEKAAAFLKGVRVDGPASVRLPGGLGQVIRADGSVAAAQWARIVPSSSGGFISAFPFVP